MNNPVEQLLLQLYAEVLSIPEDQISLEESFIALGGDSFKAIKLKRKCDRLGIRLVLRDIFARKTITTIAAGQRLVNDRSKRSQKKEKKTSAAGVHGHFSLMPHDYSWEAILEELGLQGRSPEALSELAENVYPCSPMQESIYVARETKGKHLYRIHALFELGSSVTIETLESSWQSVIDRHETLRTVFVPSTDNSPSRILDAVVLKTANHKLERIECKSYADVFAFYQESCMDPREFPKGPPHRLTTYRTENGRCFCMFDQSHMTSDGTSLVNTVTELCALAGGSILDVAPGYSGFIKHRQAELHLDEGLEYWKSYLSGSQSCNFPSLWSGSSPAEPKARGRCQVVEFPFLRHKELGRFCAKLETTISTALQAAWALLLRAYTGNDEVCFGYTCSGRDIPLDGIEMICGPLVNLVVRRVSVINQSIRKMIETVQGDFANSLPFQEVPFMSVQQLLGAAENKLFNTIMTIQYAPLLVDENDDLPLKLMNNFNASDFGLSVQVMYSDIAMKMQLTYSTDLLSTTMAEGVTKTFVSIIENFIDAASIDISAERLSVISSSDRQRVVEWNQETLNEISLPDATVHGLIEETASRRPGAPAIYFAGETFSYDDLNSMSTHLAIQMLESLSNEQRFVPLFFEKSVLYSVSLLAVLKCGRAFVPIDISNPLPRVQQLLDQLGVTQSSGLVICSTGQSEKLHLAYRHILVPNTQGLRDERAEVAADNTLTLLPVVRPSDPAYVIFTSGSTGSPKGVVVSHASYAHAARTHASGINIGPDSRVLQFASYAFDTSMEDHLTSFITGACLCVPTETERETALVEFTNQSRANWLHITPSMIDMIPPDSVPLLTTAVLGGEPMTSRNVAKWAIPGRHLIQVYGPSECSVTSTINPDVSIYRDATNIGKTFGGCATWITDPNNPNTLYPIGAVGELLMEGPILAQGYLGLTPGTEPAFITGVSWAPEKRLYRTGDMVQYDERGNLHFVGRVDSRVKIRGQRIECGEIESQLIMQNSVLHAVVAVPKAGPGAEHLVATVSLKLSEEKLQLEHARDDIRSANLDTDKMIETSKILHNWLGDRLPAYMLPDLFVFVHHIPMNSSRKLDRKRVIRYLEHMSEESYRNLVRQMDGPNQDRTGTELECSLKRVWCRVLNVPESSVNWNTSWFSSGGDSISAMMLSSELRKQSIGIAAADILRLRNIERIAARIQDRVSNDLDAKFRHINLTGTVTDVPWELSPIQQLSFQFAPDADCLDQQTMVVDTILELSDDTIIAALDALVIAHPMLLTRFTQESSEGKSIWMQRVESTSSAKSSFTIRFHRDGSTAFKLGRIAETKLAIDVIKGPVMGVDVFRSTSSTTISATIHHLVVDMVSWRTIFQDLEDFINGDHLIQPEPVSFQSWCQVQHIYSQGIQQPRVLPESEFQVDLGYWAMDKTPNLFGDAIVTSFNIERLDMAKLLDACDKLEYDQVDIMCAAVITSFSEVFQARTPPAIFIENHGRESPSNEIDLSRTVGWFTTLTPVAIRILDVKNPNTRVTILERIKKFRENTPSKGLDYFTSRFLQQEGIDAYREHHAPAEIIMNFLGTYQQFERQNSAFKRCDDAKLLSGLSTMRRDQRKKSERYSLITIVAIVEDGALSVEVEWNRKMNFQNELAFWPSKIRDNLLLLIKDLAHLSALPREGIPATQLEFTCFGVDKQKALAEVASLGLPPHEVESLYPCSPMQEGLMASLLRDSDTSSAYNQTFLFKFTSARGGAVESAQLIDVWLRMVRKHAILRTIFVENDAGDYVQVVLRRIDPVVLVKSDVDENELRSTLFESENQLLKSSLEGVPLHRFVVCETANRSTYILLTKSHLLTDGMSTQILMRDIVNGYDGIVETWEPQHYYRDYIQYVNSQDAGRTRSYWAAYLAGAATCNFPKLCHMSESETMVVSSRSSTSLRLYNLETDLRQVCRSHDLTASNIFQLAWALVLRIYLNSESILFGYLSSGRDLPIAGIQEAVGPVANMLPIRSEIRRDMKVVEVAKSLQADYIEHLSRQTLSLAQILHAARYRNQSPNFNTILNIQKPGVGEIGSKRGSSQVSLVKGIDTTEYGLALTVTDDEGEYELSLEYDTSLVSSQQAEGIVSAFANAVRNVIVNPDCSVSGIDLVGDQDRKQIRRWDIDALQTKNECVHDLFKVTALSMPGKEAIHAWDGHLTYGELEALTSKIARRLIDVSVQPEEIIPLCFEKSIWGIVAMLGVTKAGATFVHLDPSSPVSRKKKIIELTAPRVAIASVRNQGMMESLVSRTLVIGNETLSSYDVERAEVELEVPSQRANPSNALYVIFTSGSTGEPKGVVVEHRNYCSAMAANTTWLQILPSSRVLQFSSFVFDASMEEIFTALVAGACVCVPSDDHRMSPEELSSFMQIARVNWAALTPSLLQTLNPDALIPPLKFITVHAEPMNASLTRLWSPRVHMRPSYGPTECTVTSTVGSAFTEFSDSSNIGWPIGCHGRVTDPHDPQRLIPIGAVGELVLEGPILCRGYLGRPAETEKAFPNIRDWFDGSSKRIYRTGDLVRYAEDGSLRILGRRDTQIKVRGQRVELREVESQLELSPNVRHGLVLQPKSGLLQGRLVAVLSLTQSFQIVQTTVSRGEAIQLINHSSTLSEADQSTISEFMNQILSFVSAKLPSYMIPHTWCVIEDMPILPSCKLDRKLVNSWLEAIDDPTLLLARQLVRSSKGSGSGIGSDAEKLVRDAWSQVLSIPRDFIDADDHFIALGGDSISAMNVSRFLNQAGAPVKTQDVLRSNSIRELAAVLVSRERQDPAPLKTQSTISGGRFARLPSVEDLMSEYGSKSTNNAKILSVLPGTPFQLRTTSALYKSPRRPYLYNLFAEIGGYESFEHNLNPHQLIKAWRTTVARHDILRTAIALSKEGNDGYQIILEESTIACDLFEVATEQDALKASIEKTEQVKASFSETSLTPPLWLSVFTTQTRRVYVHLLMGHMLIDHVSLSHVLHDWDMSYRGHSLPGSLPQFASYVQDIESRDSGASTDFWSQRLRGVEATILPPTYEPQGDSALIEGLSTINFKISIDGNMHQYCRDMRVTISTLLQFAWAVLLGVYTSQETVCFGHLTSDRDLDIDGVDDIVGPMLSVLVTHVVLRRRDAPVASSLSETIQRLQQDNTTSMAYKVFNLTTIENQLGLQPPANMLFNTLFNYRKVKHSGPKPVMTLRPILKQDPHEQQIIISFNEVGNADSLDAALTYYDRTHSTESVQQMANAYTKIIAYLIGKECQTVDQLLGHMPDKKAVSIAV